MNAQAKILTVLLFAALFAFLGWVAPMLFYSHAPQSYYMEENSFEAGNISVGDNSHMMCFDRTFHQRSSGTVFVELYLVNGDGEKVEVVSNNEERYFQEGRRTVQDDVELPSDLETGEYRYERVYRMQVYKGQVERTFAFTSEPFYVKDGATTQYRC